MDHIVHESFLTNEESGVSFAFQTSPGGRHPMHWHEETELIYPMNGAAEITISGKKYDLPPRRLTVVESCCIHSVRSYDAGSQYLCLFISKNYAAKLMPDVAEYQICCIPERIAPEQQTEYELICSLIEKFAQLYLEHTPAFSLEADGIILQVFAKLLRSFSAKAPAPASVKRSMARVQSVISYVEEHFREPILLDDVANMLNLRKEYFCRFFKKNVGRSFLRYVNEVRLFHAYNDLLQTDMPVAEIMERNGFTNQKLFNREFKAQYGCTPSSIRKQSPPESQKLDI